MRALCVCFGMLLATAADAQAPIAVELEPHHKTVLVTPALRILEVVVPYGDETLDHTHEHDIATVCVSCATTQTRSPGEAWSDPRPRTVGGVLIAEYSGKPSAHAVRTIGEGVYRLIAIENLQTTVTTAVQPPGSSTPTAPGQISRAFRVHDVRLASGDGPHRHTHSGPTVVVLVSGDASVNGPSNDAARRLTQPGAWTLVAAGDNHMLALEGGQAAHLVEVEVR